MTTLKKRNLHRGHGETEGTEKKETSRLPVGFRIRAARYSILFCLLLAVMPARAQEKPVLSIDQECTAFAMAPDGRVVYAVRHTITRKHILMERDDIWMMGAGAKRRRIVEGEKLVRGDGIFSYKVHWLRWSPDGRRLVADLLTSSAKDPDDIPQDAEMALLLDEDGKEIKIESADSVIPGGMNAAWLADGVTLGFLSEEMRPGLLFSLNTVRPATGRSDRVFPNATYLAAAWAPKSNQAVAIERDREFSGPMTLVLLDVIKQTRKELAKLDEFAGGLSISPSGGKIAYYRDLETIEVREVAHPEKAIQVHALVGNYRWSADESRILLKPGAENKSNIIQWVTIADGTTDPILHGLTYRDFEISPDGKQVAVRIPGKGNIEVYPLQ